MKKFINNNYKIICTCILLAITLIIVIQASFSYAIDNNNGTIYTRDELSEKVNKTNMFLEIYPVGSIYQSTDATSPADLYGGTWTQTWADYERNEIASQVVHDGLSGTGIVEKTTLANSYGHLLISNLFYGVTIPVGYHEEYRLTAEVTTGGSPSYVAFFLNNISSQMCGTASLNSYRISCGTDFFKKSDIILEHIYGYETNPTTGIQVKYETGWSITYWQFWNVTIHGYLTSDDIIYKWKRTA